MIKIKNCVGLLKNTILVLFLIFSLFLFLNINVSAHITVPVGIPTITPSTDSGISNTDHITNEQNPSFTGNCQVGYTVVLFAGNDEIGSALCGVDGRYEINVKKNIDEGVHALSIAYRIGSDTSRRALKQRIIHIDLTPATAIVKIDLIDASDTLRWPEDNLTSDTTPTFSGVCVRDVKEVLLYHSTQNGSIEIGKAVCENGKFEITSNRLLKDNEYDFYVRSVDAAGNINNSLRSLSLDPLVTINTNKDFYCKGDTALSGWAWSSNIGWIDFNCANLTTDADFGVDVDDNGKLSGFAWSSNIGWIDFGYYRDAKIDLYSGKINGNVRALAGEKLIDGWHGKISLNGMTGRYGPKFNQDTGIIKGFAWGDEVVGWVSFGGTNDKYGVTYKPYTLSFSANKGLVDTNKVNYEGSVILSWKINWAPWVPQRDRTTYISCTPSDGTYEWKAETELTATTEWTEKEVAGLTKDTTFTLKCGVAERSRNILVRSPPPTLNFFIHEAKYTDRPDYINIAKGGDVNLIWESTNTTSCQTISGTPRALNLKEQGWVNRDILENGQLKISNITEHNNFFFIKCDADCDIDYPHGITRKVQVDTGKPELEFYFSPDPVPFHSKVTLHWKTRFMNRCVAKGTVPGFINDVNSDDGSHSFTTLEALLPGRGYSATIKCYHKHISGYTEKTVNITPAINPGFEEF